MNMYEKFGISKQTVNLAEEVQTEIVSEFQKIDEIKEYNSLKVLLAMQKYKVCDMHFNGTSGYGYGDIGRDTIDAIFSEVLGAEDSIVRNQFVSGTHALTIALFSMLRPGDIMLSINGKPYDTLDEVIGIVPNASSLMSYGIKYKQIDLVDNEFDEKKILQTINSQKIKLVCMQRSRGYAVRKSLNLQSMKNIIEKIKKVDKEIIIMVDNCYGEFVDTIEPLDLGADLIVGSLIKNLGGGIAQNGAYIAGKRNLVELTAERLTVPGQGKEVGATLGVNKQILQGLFMAPQVVANSIKTAVFASRMLEKLGYEVEPQYNEKRSDIVQILKLRSSEKLIKFCQGIQKGSPVDSNSIPEPWDMPGYTDKVIMAAGTFVQGSSIELSCDAPIREPFAAYLQGGLTYEYGKFGVLKAIEEII